MGFNSGLKGLMTVVSEHLVFVSFPVSDLVPGSVSSVSRGALGDHILSLFGRRGVRRIYYSCSPSWKRKHVSSSHFITRRTGEVFFLDGGKTAELRNPS
jgi:hypothetical protein